MVKSWPLWILGPFPGRDGWVTFASRNIDLNEVWVGTRRINKPGDPNLTFSTRSSGHGVGKAKDSLEPLRDEFPQEWGRWKSQEIPPLDKIKSAPCSVFHNELFCMSSAVSQAMWQGIPMALGCSDSQLECKGRGQTMGNNSFPGIVQCL